MRHLAGFLKAESGATAVEYGLIAALVTVVIIVALTAVGSSLGTVYSTWSSAVSGATN